jgi:outer membrane receptor protein involved in Fe transport
VSIQSGGYFDYSSEAFFAQATFDFTEKLSATAGIRYTKEDRDYLPDQYIEEMPLGGLPFLVSITRMGQQRYAPWVIG